MNFLSADNLESLADRIWGLVVVFVPKVVAAAMIIAVAAFLSRRAVQGLTKLIGRSGYVDPTLQVILAECIRYGIIVFALLAALEQVGVRATSLFAVLGAAGIAIGLALQGTLSNIAAGVMLLWLRPFRIGDYVEVNNVPGLAGVVRQISLFACQLQAFDGLFLFVPNSALWNVPLRNYTRNTGRLISVAITIPQVLDIETARKELVALAEKDSRASRTPAPLVFVDKITADSTVLIFRVWAGHEHISALQRDLIEAIRRTLSAIAPDAVPIQVVRITPPDTDPTRLVEDCSL